MNAEMARRTKYTIEEDIESLGKLIFEGPNKDVCFLCCKYELYGKISFAFRLGLISEDEFNFYRSQIRL